MKMLTMITISSHCPGPANFDSIPNAKASPPADKVPNPLFRPLLRVAPAQIYCDQLLFISEKLILMIVLLTQWKA